MSFRRCDEIARCHGDGVGQGCAARGLARLNHESDPVRAEALAHEALALFAEREASLEVAETLDLLAAIIAATRPVQAARLFACSSGVRAGAGALQPRPRAGPVEAALTALRRVLGEKHFDTVWAESAWSWRKGVAHASRGRGQRRRPPAGWASLSPAERDVALLVAEGLTNSEVAARLGVTLNTVKTHLTHVFGKLGTRSRAGVAGFVARNAADPSRSIIQP